MNRHLSRPALLLTAALATSLLLLGGCLNADRPIMVGCETGATSVADDGCNTCVCEDGGLWSCTEMACPESECAGDSDCFATGCSGEICAAVDVASTCEWTSDLACYASPTTTCGCFEGRCGWDPTDALAECLENPPCVEGESQPADDGCNTCYCDSDGGWACTQMACPEPECDPGEVRGECDECICDDDGQWICLAVECPEPVCEPGDVDGECGECLCTDDGEWMCLDVECPEPVCEPGDVDGECGECLCDDDGRWACEGGCEPECVPGESIPAPDGCNTCTCLGDGVWACTEVACASECTTDDDCFATGCSGQLCASVDIATTCEWLPAYACFASPTTACGCFDGVCQWDATAALDECLGLD